MQYIGLESIRDRRFWSHWIGRNCGALIVASIASLIANVVFGQIVYAAIPGHLLLGLPRPFWLFIDVFIGVWAGLTGGVLLGILQHYLLWQARVSRRLWILATAFGGALAWPLIYSLSPHWMQPLNRTAFALGIGRYSDWIFFGVLMLLGAIGGMIIGGLQGLALRQQHLKWFLWIVTMLLSGALAVGVFISIITLLAMLLLGGAGD
jgi:hypothetical protein